MVFAYLAQDAIDLRWTWLDRLQTVDEFKYATGACLLLYVGWQWYLFLARQQGRKITLLLPLHQRSGVFAPVLFYVHSMQIGYGYLAVLSWVFLGNIVVGLVTPAGIKIRSRAYTFSWGVVHVMLAALTVILGFFHGYIALYYK